MLQIKIRRKRKGKKNRNEKQILEKVSSVGQFSSSSEKFGWREFM